MTPDETRAQLLDAVRALVPFAHAARDEHRRDRLALLADMIEALGEASARQIVEEGPRMAHAITWAAHLLPTEGDPC